MHWPNLLFGLFLEVPFLRECGCCVRSLLSYLLCNQTFALIVHWTFSFQTTVKKTLMDFKRTHQDNWEEHKMKFSEDQLSILTDLLVSPSYYAWYPDPDDIKVKSHSTSRQNCPWTEYQKNGTKKKEELDSGSRIILVFLFLSYTAYIYIFVMTIGRLFLDISIVIHHYIIGLVFASLPNRPENGNLQCQTGLVIDIIFNSRHDCSIYSVSLNVSQERNVARILQTCNAPGINLLQVFYSCWSIYDDHPQRPGWALVCSICLHLKAFLHL